MIVRPLPPTQSTSNTIRPTSQDFAPPTALAKTQAHQVYSTAINTLSKLCGTPKLDDNDPKIIPRSATVCPRLNPIAAKARITQSQPGAPTVASWVVANFSPFCWAIVCLLPLLLAVS